MPGDMLEVSSKKQLRQYPKCCFSKPTHTIDDLDFFVFLRVLRAFVVRPCRRGEISVFFVLRVLRGYVFEVQVLSCSGQFLMDWRPGPRGSAACRRV